MEHKRVINEEIHEKETVQATANDLRNQVKRSEGEKTELNRLLQEARQRIGGQSVQPSADVIIPACVAGRRSVSPR